MEENGETQSGTPQAFLNSVVGQPVWVRLNSGIDYKGKKPSNQHPFAAVLPAKACGIALMDRSIDVSGRVYECCT